MLNAIPMVISKESFEQIFAFAEDNSALAKNLYLPMDRGLGEQPFVSTVSIWLICLMFERRKRHGFKNKTLYR